MAANPGSAELVALTSALRRAVKTRVSETGRPSAGQRCPFIHTANRRSSNSVGNRRIFRFLFRRTSLIEIRNCAFITSA